MHATRPAQVALLLLHALALTGCCFAHRPAGAPLLETCLGGGWQQDYWFESSVLAPGAELVRWRQLGNWARAPGFLTLYVNDREGAGEVHIETIDDLRPFLEPIDTPELAVTYGNLIRESDLDQTLPHLRPGTLETFRRSPLLDEQVWNAGLDPDPVVEWDGERYLVRRLVLRVQKGKATQLLRIREEIGPTGSYDCVVEEELDRFAQWVPILLWTDDDLL